MTVTRTAALMVQGTGSDVGKSLLVAGLCRAFHRHGLKVRPFKPQNMSNNAAVTDDGGEIGRAQALQALAASTQPVSDMNPVLLKPESDSGAQLVVQGRVRGHSKARDYHALKSELLPKVLESFHRLSEGADLVLVEGAGSPAEINLRDGDIANMGFAAAADVPVLLLGDIARGGVIAQIVGTWQVLEPDERARIRGYIINRFHGDASLFDDGLREITERTGLPSLGVVPDFPAARRLPAEDSVGLDSHPAGAMSAVAPADAIHICVPVTPRISNFDDLDPLRAEPDVRLDLVRPGQALPGDADLIILAGSKSTIGDLAVLRAEGWDIDIMAHRRRGGRVLGLCGGYQMLGRAVSDAKGIEGGPGTAPGLGLLEMETELEGEKTLRQTSGTERLSGASVTGYRMHVGHSTGAALARPMLALDDGPDGAMSEDGLVAGCYLHGLFAADGFRGAFLNRIKDDRWRVPGIAYGLEIEGILDQLADHLEAHLDVGKLLETARGN